MSFLNIPIPSLVVPKQTFSAPGALRGIAGIPSTRMAVIGSGRFENYRPLRETMEGSKRIEFKFIEASWKGELVLGQIRESLLALEEFKPDCIVAMGGGRILDGCKLLWAFYEHPNLEAQRLYIAFSIPELRRKARFCMVPTTNGTGSECSSSAVYTETGDRPKNTGSQPRFPSGRSDTRSRTAFRHSRIAALHRHLGYRFPRSGRLLLQNRQSRERIFGQSGAFDRFSRSGPAGERSRRPCGLAGCSNCELLGRYRSKHHVGRPRSRFGASAWRHGGSPRAGYGRLDSAFNAIACRKGWKYKDPLGKLGVLRRLFFYRRTRG